MNRRSALDRRAQTRPDAEEWSTPGAVEDTGRPPSWSRWVPAASVFAIFIATALIVPILAPVPISDDWLWARAVESLLDERSLTLPDMTAPTLVFQMLWGAAFSLLFEPTFGVLRLSTMVLVLLSGVAFYGLCRELDISPRRSALALAVYLFHPLAYGITFTFMTDPHFLALLVIAAYLYVRGMSQDAGLPGVVLAGSAVSACAFLVRPQAAFIPAAVVTYLVIARRLHLDWAGLGLLVRIVGVPLAAVIAYQLWLHLFHGVPTGQEDFLGNFRRSGLVGNLRLAGAVAFISAMYVGLFVAPIALASLPRLPSIIRSWPWRRLLVGIAWTLSLIVGAVFMARRDRLMPYAGLFLDQTGIGPQDVVGGRRPLIGDWGLGWVTAATAALAAVFGLLLLRPPPRAWRGPAGLVLALLAWQLLGVVPPSGQKVIGGTRIITFDRYLLVLLPFALCLGLWALQGVRFPQLLAWATTITFGVFSVVGTRDLIVWQKATWALAHEANCIGVPNDRFDGGHAWTGYYLSDLSYPKQPPRTPPGHPWWMEQLGPASDSLFLLSTVPLPWHTVIRQVEYSQWLQTEPTYIYLLRREDTVGPPPPVVAPGRCPPAPQRLRT